MTRRDELVATIHNLQPDDLDRWIGAALLTPELDEGEATFGEPDRVRVQLLCTLRYTLEIEEETLPLVLSLIDQLYATRARLRVLARVVAALEPSVQEGILATMAEQPGTRPY